MDQVEEPVVVDKRIVLIPADGPHRIISRATSQPPDLLMYQDNEEDPPVMYSLIKVTPRAYMFREIVPPMTGKFNDFHPQQQ